MPKTSVCLWFDGKAEDAARFYVSLIAGSSVDHVARFPIDTPGGHAGQAMMVEFTLGGQPYKALNGGPHYTLTPATSIIVEADDQAELDRLWASLTADGGRAVQCGWLVDRFGLSWQVVPAMLPRLMKAGDPAGAQRIMAALMSMTKLDIAALERAYAGG